MIRIMGYTAHMNPSERMSSEELVRFVSQFASKQCVFIFERHEVQLHAIKYSNREGVLQFLLKSVQR